MKSVCALTLSLAGLGACGKDKSPGTSYEPFDVYMYHDDVDAIRVDSSSESAYGRSSTHFDPFVAFFGERSGEAVRAFVNERIHHVTTLPRYRQAERALRANHAAQLKYMGWENMNLSPSDQLKFEDRLGALNVGMGVWFAGRVNEIEDLTWVLDGKKVTFDSSRVGVIAVPDDYRNSLDKEGRLSPDVLQILRQSILVHEARHSDCTGGLLEATLNAAREAPDYATFSRNSDLQCGHFHALCPAGDLRGMPACDIHAWGSYAAGQLFLEEAMKREDLSATDRGIMATVSRGYRQRFLFNYFSMVTGRMGPPDSGHSDEVVPNGRGRDDR